MDSVWRSLTTPLLLGLAMVLVQSSAVVALSGTGSRIYTLIAYAVAEAMFASAIFMCACAVAVMIRPIRLSLLERWLWEDLGPALMFALCVANPTVLDLSVTAYITVVALATATLYWIGSAKRVMSAVEPFTCGSLETRFLLLTSPPKIRLDALPLVLVYAGLAAYALFQRLHWNYLG